MNAQLREKEVLHERFLVINNIREKAKLTDKCRRKMQLAALDSDSMMILMAAYAQLTSDIKRMCHRIGL